MRLFSASCCREEIRHGQSAGELCPAPAAKMVSGQRVEVSLRTLGGLRDRRCVMLGPGLQQGRSTLKTESSLRVPLAFEHGSAAPADPRL